MTQLPDAHAHLPDRNAPLPCEAGAMVLVNTTCPEEWPEAAKLTAHVRGSVPFFGLHPWKVAECREFGAELEAFLDRFLPERAPERFGVGEIGLDACRPSWRTAAGRDAQCEAFQQQLAVAVRRRVPVAIHVVRAWDDALDILRRTDGAQRVPLIFHNFGASPELIAQLTRFGRAYFSFREPRAEAGWEKLALRLRAVRPERLLLETDAPAFAQPPSFADFYRRVAGVLGRSEPELVALVAANVAGLARF